MATETKNALSTELRRQAAEWCPSPLPSVIPLEMRAARGVAAGLLIAAELVEASGKGSNR